MLPDYADKFAVLATLAFTRMGDNKAQGKP